MDPRPVHLYALGRPSVVCWIPLCGYETPSPPNLMRHVQNVHGHRWWEDRKPGWSSPSGRAHRGAGIIRSFAALEVPVADREGFEPAER